MIPVCIGYDPRESAVFHALEQSLMRTSSCPLALIPLHSPMLGDFDGQQDGTNAFIYSRFLVPELMDFQGWAIYMDSDMIFLDDIQKLWDLRDESKAVMVVKHDYQTTEPRKFVGTPLEAKNEDYPRKNWSSLILWNCAHPQNRILRKDYVAEAGGRILHRFSWLSDDQIGEIPVEWNHLAGEYAYNPEAKNIHFTLGAPGFPLYADSDYASQWNSRLLDGLVMADTDPEDMIRRAKDGIRLRIAERQTGRG